jgi:hypothetical protein
VYPIVILYDVLYENKIVGKRSSQSILLSLLEEIWKLTITILITNDKNLVVNDTYDYKVSLDKCQKTLVAK